MLQANLIHKSVRNVGGGSSRVPRDRYIYKKNFIEIDTLLPTPNSAELCQ